MIGFYNYTVIVTYLSLLCSMFGMVECVRQSSVNGRGDFRLAVLMLALSGLCDMFDGKIARTKKERTEDEKKFGVQLDSLCDVVCFGAYPVLLGYCIGMRGKFSGAIFALYVIGAVVRLAFFNVMEDKRQKETTENRKEYRGLPVTSIAVIFPVAYFVGLLFKSRGYEGGMGLILQIAMLVTGVLFVVDFKVKKPGNLMIAVFALIVAIVMLVVFRGFIFKKKNVEEKNGKWALGTKTVTVWEEYDRHVAG